MHMETTTCPKCHGQKKLQHYSHIAEGDCFECKATGVVSASKGGSIFDGAPDVEMTEERALDQLRVYYIVARREGAVWFEADEHAGWDGWAQVRYHANHVSAPKRAQVLASFAALAA